jgi:DNA-directed RNA polymerase specialized sigma24 family protein
MSEEWLLYGETADVIGEPHKAFARFDGQFVLIPTDLLGRISDEHEHVPGEIALGMLDADAYFDAVDDFQEIAADELVDDLEEQTVYSRREAQMVVFHGWFDMGRQEIARELSVAPNTVDNHLRAARDRLDRAMQAVKKSSGF